VERAVHKVRPYVPFNWLDTLDDPLVIISQGANAEGGPWAAACIERKLPYVLISHSAGVPWWPDDAKVYAMRRAHEHALASFFVSQQNLEMTRRQLVVEGRQFEVVWNPFNLRYEASPPWPKEDEPLKLACLARIDVKIKGQDLLIDVMNQAKWRQRAVVVDCFGTGPNDRVVPEYVEKIGLSSVRFRGFESDVEKVWASHHALVLTSRVEGLPLVVIEATLCGRPCVVTDVGGNREIVEDDVTGFVARSASVDSVDEAMERMWRRRGELRAMGAKGAERLRARLPRDPGKVFAERLMELMKA
jgi:glycosyltransferase involved in cell wall biosynthesis